PSGRRPEADRDAVTPKATQAPATASAAAIAATAPPPERRDEAGWRAPAASEPAMPPGAIPYLDYLGIRVAPDPIAPTFRLPFDPKLVGNPFLPALHGGVVAGFAETAAILHLNQTLGGQKLPEGIDCALDYLR